MTKRQSEIDQVFLEAIECSPEDRSAFLEQRCASLDPTIREEVEKLLDADGEASEADLTAAAPRLDVAKFLASTHAGSAKEDVGSVIGPYRLLQQIGEGGMGSVFMAEQKQPVRRRVALKVIKPGMDSKQVVARFEAERQALAMMEHPNIAKVLDVGTTDGGRPYFVMELVMGIPITRFCEEKRLPVSERLKLFMSVCHAVQHAHQKGIVHRDLKPTNILIAEYDNAVVPKIIDFGLAKAIHQQLTEKTLFTQFGQVVGTFEYMSPEQAKLNQLDIDTRTDIYSLGVVLYELLTGCTPLDSRTLRHAAFDEMLRIIREVDPPRPSTRLTGEPTSSATAAGCRTEPKKLSLLLRGDLDAIVMKALDKERNRRYETSTALAEDIQRFINHQPVLATPASSLYYLKRFVRRNRVAVATVCGIFFVLLTATALTTLFGLTSRRLAQRNQGLLQEQIEATNLVQKARNAAEASAQDLRRSLYVSDMNAAFHAWEDGSERRAHELLAGQFPTTTGSDLRGIEWYHLAARSAANRGEPLVQTDLGCGWCLRPDKKLLATVKDGNLIQLDLDSRGVEVLVQNDASGSLTWRGSLAYTPDGERLAATTATQVRVIDVATGKVQYSLPGTGDPNARFRRICFSPNGKWGANVVIPPVTSEKQPESPEALLQVWEAETGEIVFTDSGADTRGNGYLLFSPDSQHLVACGFKKSLGAKDSLAVWHTSTWKRKLVPTNHRRATFVSDTELVTAGWYSLSVVNVELGQIISDPGFTLPNDVGIVGALDADIQRRWITLGTGDRNSVEVWNVATSRRRAHRTRYDSVHEVRCDGGRDLVYSSSGRQIELWNVKSPLSGRFPWKDARLGFPYSVSVRQSKVYFPATDARVLIWNTDDDSGTMLDFGYSVAEADGFPRAMAVSSDGSLLACTDSRGRNPILWDLERNQLIAEIPEAAEIQRLAFSADHRSLAVASSDGIGVWDVPTFKQVWAEPNGREKFSVIFSRDGNWLYAGGVGTVGSRHDHLLFVWDLRSQVPKFVRTFRHDGIVSELASSADGKWIAAGDMAGRIAVHDVGHPDAKPKDLLGHRGRITSLDFAPHGRLLVSGSMEGQLKFWQTRPWRELGTSSYDGWIVGTARIVESTKRGFGLLVGRPTQGAPIVNVDWETQLRSLDWSWLTTP